MYNSYQGRLKLYIMKTEFTSVRKVLLSAFSVIAMSVAASAANDGGEWTATWAAAPQLAAGLDMPAGSDLSESALRQVIHVSTGGDVLRLKLSNEYSKVPVEIKSVYVATAKDSCDIDVKTAEYLHFGKKKGVTIPAGGTAWSDELKFNVKPLQLLSVTISYGATPKEATAHLGSRTTSYIIKGEAKPKTSFKGAEKVVHWYNIASLDVKGNAGVIAVIGNSITDGRGSTTDKQNRWTDVLAESMHAAGVNAGVLNLGIGGNFVLRYGLGTPAVERYDRDILAQSGVTTVVIFEGVNDIGATKGNAETVAKELTEAYTAMAEKAHKQGLKVYCATITPFKGHSYYTHFHEAARRTVNDWIRGSKCFDGIIDFDKLMGDPSDPAAIRKGCHEDGLHPNAAGYKMMGEYAAKVLLESK